MRFAIHTNVLLQEVHHIPGAPPKQPESQDILFGTRGPWGAILCGCVQWRAGLGRRLCMDEPLEKPPFGWQPLTRRGVAAFAPASLGKLLLVQFIVALLAAGALVWFLRGAWFSAIGEAITRLPAQGAIRSGALDWPGEPAVKLAENHFLALAVDLSHAAAVRSPAHLQVEFGRNDVELISLGRLSAHSLSARLAADVQSNGIGALVGSLGAGSPGVGGGTGGYGPDVDLECAGHALLPAGMAGRVHGQPRI